MSNKAYAEREAIRQCIVPTFWNLPESPPGIPSSVLEKKFEHFRELKQKNVHLNENLDNLTSFQNPCLLDKLVNYVGIKDHYGSNLPEELQTWKKLLKLKVDGNEIDHISSKTEDRTSNESVKKDIYFVPERYPSKNN